MNQSFKEQLKKKKINANMARKTGNTIFILGYTF